MSDKSPQEIEREIELERAELSRTLDDLSGRFSVDNVVNQVSTQVQTHGGEMASNLARTIKQAPAAAILTAIGIGWMMYASGKREQDERYRYADERFRGSRDGTLRPPDYGRREYMRDVNQHQADLAQVRRGDEGRHLSDLANAGRGAREGSYETPTYLAGSGRDEESDLDRPPPAPAYAATPSRPTASGFRRSGDYYDYDEFETRVAAAERTSSRRQSYVDRYGYEQDDDDGFLDRLGDRAEEVWGTITANVRGAWRRTYDSAAQMRARLMEGTDDMDEQGKDRVARARALAYQAQSRAEMMARRGRRQASNFFYDQPMVAGALAMAVGAVVGGLLPRTQREDQAFGAYRDQLFANAEAVFQEEKARAEGAARAALSEAKEIAKETVDSARGATPDGRAAVDAADDKVRSAATRVADAAREGADKKKAS